MQGRKPTDLSLFSVITHPATHIKVYTAFEHGGSLQPIIDNYQLLQPLPSVKTQVHRVGGTKKKPSLQLLQPDCAATIHSIERSIPKPQLRKQAAIKRASFIWRIDWVKVNIRWGKKNHSSSSSAWNIPILFTHT